MKRSAQALGIAAILGLAAMLPLTGAAPAQDWPTRPIKIVTPLAPGAAGDLIARSVGDAMAVSIKQPVVVENRPGGGGAIAAEFVARSAPDGYTVLLGTAGTNGIAYYLRKKPTYEPVKDFTPLANAVEIPIALVVHRSLPVASVAEFVDYAKKNPGKISFGSSGHGTTLHLAGEVLKARAGIDIVHVSYRGGAPAMNDLLAGQIPAAISILSTAAPYLDSGDIKILGTTGVKRTRVRPDIPTIRETVADYEMPPSWVGFLAPGGMPTDLATRMNAELVKAINAPQVRKLLEDSGFEIVTGPSADFADMLQLSMQRFGKIIAEAGIAPQ